MFMYRRRCCERIEPAPRSADDCAKRTGFDHVGEDRAAAGTWCTRKVETQLLWPYGQQIIEGVDPYLR